MTDLFGMRSKLKIWTSLLLLLVGLNSCAQSLNPDQSLSKPLAFPGADGFGKYTTGGRGGEVIIVSNLNDSGPGCLREAIKKKGPRIITFEVAGTIELQSPLVINNDDVTIAGQSAPGDGICIRNQIFRVSANNVIIRYMRFRLGDESKVQDDAFGGYRQKNIIIDHCSISWATDECASFYYNENFTMQWCLISESLNNSVHEKGEHGYGGIWGGMNASFHHNLISHHTSRLPRFSGSSTVPNPENELVDFRNNVIYNWEHNNTYGGEKGRYNVVNNYYKPGPATNKNSKTRIINPSKPYGQFYIEGNTLDQNSEVSNDNKLGVIADLKESLLVSKPFLVEEIDAQNAADAYRAVLKSAGASFKRDTIDSRVVWEVSTGTATYGKDKKGIIDSQKEVGGWPELRSAREANDTDHDGMDDAWEKKNKLNPHDPTDASLNTLSKSYTNIEVFLNSLVN
jgi:hypothetical protein